MSIVHGALTWSSVGAATVAAALWWWSATLRLPRGVAAAIGNGGNLPAVVAALRDQSWWNAAAAVAAGVAALMQTVDLAISAL